MSKKKPASSRGNSVAADLKIADLNDARIKARPGPKYNTRLPQIGSPLSRLPGAPNLYTANFVPSVPAAPGAVPHVAGVSPLSAGAFQKANEAYQGMQRTKAPPASTELKGFRNRLTLAKALAAQGKNLAD